ncbi:MAG: hypothetical protein ABR538_04505, partial [Candidatus Binatia bacterium]
MVKISRTILTSLLIGAWTLAATPAEALNSPEIACRDTIAKSEAKYAKIALSTVQRCHKRRSAGDRPLGEDCNDVLVADDRGKLVAARTRSRSKIASACGGAPSLLSQYPACPAPASSVDDGGATTEIDDFNEVANCLLALLDAGVGELAADAMGLPAQRLLKPVLSCQQAAGRAAGDLVRTYLVERRKCQRSEDETGGPAYSCEGSDPRERIARAQASLADRIFDDCRSLPDEEVMKLEACGETTAALADCAQSSADNQGAHFIRNAYELPEAAPTTTTSTTTTTLVAACGSTFPQCDGECDSGAFCENTGLACECVTASGACAPATLLRHLNARNGTPAGQTQLSTGWTGKTHVVDVPDDSFDAVDVTCDGNCENCDVSYNKRFTDPTSSCRCASNPRTICNAIGGADATNCGSLNPNCICYFGPALAISSGGTPVCVLNQIREDYGGTMDLRTGSYSDIIKLSSLVHLGVSQFAPCPTCEGDDTPYDGVRDGSCNGGLQNGQTCDVNGVHRTFGPTSFDCPPATASNISGSGLQIELNLTSETRSLTAALPCDSPSGALCPCRVCSGNSQLGCTSNADCAVAGAGACTEGGNIAIEPNQCDDGICSAAGFCEAGPVDQFCDGALHNDGRGFVSCTTNADCVALEAGACTVLDLRRCFPDPIVVSGSADVANPVNAAIFCIPPTTNDPVNLTAGLPGPGTIHLDFDVDVRCQSDLDLVYEFPDGANCPDLGTTTTTTSTTTTLPLPACGD